MHGKYYSPMWRVDAPHRNVRLYRTAELEKSEEFFRGRQTTAGTLEIKSRRACVIFSGPARITLAPGRNFRKLSAFKDGRSACDMVRGGAFRIGRGLEAGFVRNG